MKKIPSKGEAEKELKKLAFTLGDFSPTTTKQGRAEYKRVERQIQKLLKNNMDIGRWQTCRLKIVLALIDFDRQLGEELFFVEKKKKGENFDRV